MEDKKIGQYRPGEFLWLGETSESIHQGKQVQIGLVAACPPTMFNFEQTGGEELSFLRFMHRRSDNSGRRSQCAYMPRVLIADDDEAVRNMLPITLERDGFEVVAVASVSEALNRIATENFDVLLSDLHMPQAGDGFTVVSAMRHTHPKAVTLVLSGYPALDEALAAIRLQADEVLVKPIEIASLREIIREKLANCMPRQPVPMESVASILERDLDVTIQDWMTLAEQDQELTRVRLSFEDRTGHLPNLLAEVIYRLRLPPICKSQHLPGRASARHSATSTRLHRRHDGGGVADPPGEHLQYTAK
jgi:DNA-binding response OmpR family regulator